MSTSPSPKGPKRQRILIGFFSIVLTTLLVWLIGFLVADIGRIPGPDPTLILEKHVTAELREQEEQLRDELETVSGQIETQREVQSILATSTSNSQQTMNQLIEIHRHNLDQQVTPTQEEQAALAESEQRFLENQRKFQEANETIARLSEQKRDLESQQKDLEERLQPLREEADKEYGHQYNLHQLRIAALKLTVLLPLFFIAAWLLKSRRGTPYGPLFVAFFVASFLQVTFVIHEYFPARYFKYIAVAAAIVVVIAILRFLIRRVSQPDRSWLLQQYREGYQKHLCPVCSYPIERGIFRQALWTSKGPKTIAGAVPEENASKEGPYVCPSCGTTLFEKCDQCQQVRHALLSYCENCGVEKSPGR